MSGASRDEQVGSPDLDGPQYFSDTPSGRPVRRKRRSLRIALIAAGTVFVLAVAVVVGGYAAANHFVGSVKRIPNVFVRLDAAKRPVVPAADQQSMTILLTGSGPFVGPQQGYGADGASTAAEGASGLIALVHFDADLKAGSVVSIPPNAEVSIPGHGRSELENALVFGGPSLLIQTIEQLTDVRVDHYAVVNFGGLISALGPLGGVNVHVPVTTSSDGVVFHAGVNYLTTSTALPYVRQSSLTEEGRVLRQQALLRAIVAKVVSKDLITNPLRDLRLLDAFTAALSVDSDFTNSGLLSLAGKLHLLRAGSSTFVTAPVLGSAANSTPVQLDTQVADELWQAIRHDSVAAFARQFPATLTPAAPN